MRYSAEQEDCFGVGLGQETPLIDVDDSIMAATGDSESGGDNTIEEGSMISNLPLLFANGYPTSMDKITLPELERFITFMVQCSSGHETSEAIAIPRWWPKEVKFSIPLVTPKELTDDYMDSLKKLVFRCYTYHHSEYLLRFCSYLSQYPHDKLEYVDNWDSTTSLFLKTTGKLLVTFRHENMDYDKEKPESPKKMLLVTNKKTATSSNSKSLRRRATKKLAPSPAMVEPAIEDIYLCDSCDAEFVGLHKMKEHEKLCYPVEPRPPTPEVVEQEEVKQDQFMDYFKLRSSSLPEPDEASKSAALPFESSSSQNRNSSRIRGSVNLARCPTIPFSSPVGLALAKRSKMMTEETQQERLDRIERHLTAPPLALGKPKWFTKCYEYDRWQVTYKSNRDKTVKPHDHLYNFADYRGKPALDLRSQLMYISCKKIYVVVNKLTDKELEELKRDPSRYKSPERQVTINRPRSPSVETVKSAAPGDENNPIVIDLEDDEPEVPIIMPRFQEVTMAKITPISPSLNSTPKTSPQNTNLAQTVIPFLPSFIHLPAQNSNRVQSATITLPSSSQHPTITKTATITLPLMYNLSPRKTPTASVPPYTQTVSPNASHTQTTPSPASSFNKPAPKSVKIAKATQLVPSFNKPSPKSVKLAKAASVTSSFNKPSPKSVKLAKAASSKVQQQQQQTSRNVAKRTRASEPIIFVDLCSSDEEIIEEDVDLSPYLSADESYEPIRKSTKRATELRLDPSFLCSTLLTPSKLCDNPCIYTADSTNNWMPSLNVDGQSDSHNRDIYLKHAFRNTS